MPDAGACAFEPFAEIYVAAKGVAHRKAIVYVVHELLKRKGGEALAPEERRSSCMGHFLVRIGNKVRALPVNERESYCKLVTSWEKGKLLRPAELAELKEAWDMD